MCANCSGRAPHARRVTPQRGLRPRLLPRLRLRLAGERADVSHPRHQYTYTLAHSECQQEMAAAVGKKNTPKDSIGWWSVVWSAHPTKSPVCSGGFSGRGCGTILRGSRGFRMVFPGDLGDTPQRLAARTFFGLFFWCLMCAGRQGATPRALRARARCPSAFPLRPKTSPALLIAPARPPSPRLLIAFIGRSHGPPSDRGRHD